ncbi:MAG: hypothetical protein ABSC41_07415 [Acidimicrobiales bacterium]|jgi:hypothetical protein
MANPLGPLGPADERFDHQIADTFATVGLSDPSWTEKVCAMTARRDGSLQLGFGMGKYTNRNVLDGYAGLSRGPEQITVRASRRLFPRFDDSSVGPIHYEVLEPMKRVRFVLEPNPCQPLAFDWVFEGVLPPATEERTHQRTPLGYRVSADLVRYHQIGTSSGWVEIDGIREDITSDRWVSTRDHSWGVRYDVGTPPTDTDPFNPVTEMNFQMIWSPILMTDPDGAHWGLFMHLIEMTGFGHHRRTVTGAIEHDDGRVERMTDIRPNLAFDPVNRRLLGGDVTVTLDDGSVRSFLMEVPTATGFHLGTGLYFGWQGHHHGEWRGELHVDGERIEDCRPAVVARQLHQIRDTFVVVRDLDSGAEGQGNCQPMITGAHPALGLDADSSFW